MAEEFDIKFAAVAVALIDKFGIPAQYIVLTDDAVYDPSTIDPNAASHDQTSAATNVTSSPALNYKREFIDGTTIQVGDNYVFIYSYDGLLPKTGDDFIIHSKTFSIKGVQPYYSGELVAAWKLQLRKGVTDGD
jgi:hypothetical protein